MPFQSEKQRRYLHANHPEIANRWEAKYGLGGIAELNSQLNSLPEYYLPKNQGGRIGFAEGPKIPEKFLEDLKRKNYYKLLEEYRRWKEDYDRRKDLGVTQEAAHGGLIPSHEAGIYGLAEGGAIAGGHQIGTPIGNRTGFGNPFGYSDAPATVSSTAASEDAYGTPETTTITSDAFVGGEDQEADVTRMMLDMGIKPDHSPNYSGDRGWVNPEDDYGSGDYSTNKDKAYDFDFMYGHKIKPKDQWTEHNKRNAWIEKKQLGKEIFDAFKFGVGPISLIKFGWQQSKKKKAEKEHLQKMIDRMKEAGMTKFSLHSDTPLQLAEQLMIDLNTSKKQPDQDDGPTAVASITYDDMEDKNKKERASMRWVKEQEKVDRSKQMAYWRMMMQPYMSAKGGRVPAGYNTGGLSNLFRLKNV